MAHVMQWLTAYYEGDGCPWNYRIGTRAIRLAYKGFDRLDFSSSSCQQIENKQGRISNGEVIELAAPKAFGVQSKSLIFPQGSSLSAGSVERPTVFLFSWSRVGS